jgi:hypothetical protein
MEGIEWHVFGARPCPVDNWDKIHFVFFLQKNDMKSK